MDRKEIPYDLEFIKTDPEPKVGVDNFNSSSAIDPLAGIGTEIEGIIIMTIKKITDPTLEMDLEMSTGMITEEIPTGPIKDTITTDRTIEGEITIGKTIEIDKMIEEITIDKDTGVRVERG